MPTAIENQKEVLRSLFEKNNLNWTSLPSLLKYSYLYAFYECFDADELSILNMSEGVVFKTKADDGIACLYETSDSGCDYCLAIVPFHLGDYTPDVQCAKCASHLQKAESALFSCLDKSLFAREELSARLRELGIGEIDKERKLKILLLSDDEKVSAATARKIRKYLSSESTAKPSHSHVEYEILFSEDVTGVILETEGQRPYVPLATITVDNVNNICRFGAEGSIVVNISAQSVKDLYNKYRWSGLFAQNLRFYVRMPNVDDAIKRTIENTPDLFWYLNNGIIIICDSFKTISPTTLELENMSIINGGQTTRQIGEIDFKGDFFLLCKIIKSTSSVESERVEFISNVADASNRQKPIKSEDLIANSPVQRAFKAQLLNAGIFCEIKRGEGKGNKRIYPQPWQRTSNKALAKILMSFMYQEPGLVRNSSAAVLSARCINLVFGSKIKSETDTYSSDMIRDLLKFATFLKEWSTYVYKNSNDQEKVGLVANSDKLMTAVFGVLMKYWFNRALIPNIAKLDLSGSIHAVRQYDINCPLFADNVEHRQKDVFKLLELLFDEILLPAFRDYKYQTNKTIPSNFAKTDICYKAYVLHKAINFFDAHKLSPGSNDLLNELANTLFHKATEDEFKNNQGLQAKYGTNFGPQKKPAAKIKDPRIRKKLKEKLMDLRKKVANKHGGIKVADVFDNTMLDKLLKSAPNTDQELKDLGFEDTYGISEEIFKITSKYQPEESEH